MRKKVGIIKRNIATFLIIAMSINSFAAIVSDNDGSAFITKAEFDALKSSFQSQIDSYNQSIDSKIDGAIASYLAGIRISNMIYLDNLLSKYRITGVTYDGGKLYWSATKKGLCTTNNSRLTWRASVAYGIANYGIATGSVVDATSALTWIGTGRITWHRVSLHDFKSPADLYTFTMDDTGKILRASNRQYCMNSSLIWQSIGRNSSSDIKPEYSAGGTFNFAYWFSDDNKIKRLTKPVWSKYRLGNTDPKNTTAITYGYTSFTCEDNDLPNTVECPVYAGTTTSGTTYYADDVTVDELAVGGTTLYNIMTLADYTMTTPDNCDPMVAPPGTNLGAPLRAYVTNHMKAIQPNSLIFDDFVKLNSKNNCAIKNGICIIDNIEKTGTLKLEFTASTAGRIVFYTNKGAVLTTTGYIDVYNNNIPAGANVVNLPITEKNVYLAMAFYPTSGNGKIDNLVTTLITED